MARIDEIKVRLSADTASFINGMKAAQTTLKQTASSLKATGEEISLIGRGLTAAITTPLLGIGVAAGKAASSFESEMTKIETLVGIAREEVQAFSGDVLSLAGRTAKAPVELAQALFTVTSAGARGAEAIEILSNAAKASAAGLGETSGIARTVTAALQAYGSENLSAGRATDILVATVREGNLEASALAGSLGRVIGIAAQVGVEFEQVGAFIATFTRLGVSAEESVTALRGVLQTIIRPTKQSADALAEMGLSTEFLRDSIREKGLAEALVDLVARFKGNEEALAKVIPNVEALSGVLGTAGVQAQQFVQIQQNIRNSLGITDEAFKRTKDNVQFQFQQLLAEVQIIGIQLGDALLPAARELTANARPLVAQAKELVARFKALAPETRTAAIRMTALAAAVGPALLVFGGFLRVMGSLVGLTGRLTAGVVLLTRAFVGLFSILSVKVTAVVAVFAAFSTVTRFLADNLPILSAKVKTFALEFERSVVQAVQAGLRALSTFFSQIPLVGPALSGAASAAAAGLDQQIAGINQSLSNLAPEASRSFVSIRDAFSSNLSDLGTVAGALFSDVADVVIEGAISVGERAGRSLVESFGASAEAGVEGIKTKIDEASAGGALNIPFTPKVEAPKEFEKEKDKLAKGRTVSFEAEVNTATAQQKLAALDGFIIATTRRRDPIEIEARTEEARARLGEIRTILDALPEEQRIALDADVSRVETKLAGISEKARTLDVTVTVDADTSQAEAAIADLEAGTRAIDREFSSIKTGEGVEISGDLATNAEIAAQQTQFFAEAVEAVTTGDLPEMLRLLNAGNDYLRSFADGIRMTGGSTAGLTRAVVLLGQGIRGLGGVINGINGTVPLIRALDAVTLRANQARAIELQVNATGSPTLPISDYFGRYLPRKIEDSIGKIGRSASLVIPTELSDPAPPRIGGTASIATARRADAEAITASVERLRTSVEGLLERQNALTGVSADNLREIGRAVGGSGLVDAQRRLESRRTGVRVS